MGRPQRVLTVDQLRGELQKRVPESDWQEELIRRARSRGFYVLHVPSNVVRCPRCSGMIYRKISKGWVDLILINPPWAYFWEVKENATRLFGPSWTEVMDMLRRCGRLVLVARPRDREKVLRWIDEARAVRNMTRRPARGIRCRGRTDTRRPLTA